MLHLLDANTLIDANRDYYPIGRVDEFWAWLLHMAETGRVKLPLEMYEEVEKGTDDLAQWVREHKETLLLDESANEAAVAFVVERGYAPDLADDEIAKVGRDPFLVAYALASGDRVVVTTERSSPKALRANRKVPDVCESVGVVQKPINTFELIRRLDFRTNWQRPAGP